MKNPDTDHLITDAAWEMEQVLGEWRLALELDITTLLALANGLQIALRSHSFRRRPSAKLVRRFVDQLIAGIPETAPATKRVAELGDKPEYDWLR
jgi:hypothetical protein